MPSNPKESHLTFFKRIIRYISETLDYGLWYPFDSSFVIIRYFDVGWAKNVDRKNSSGTCLFVSDCLVV